MQATVQTKATKDSAQVRVQDGAATRRAASQRLCVVCRKAQPCAQLVQLKLARALSTGARGRSAYVCIDTACLTRLHEKTLGRALKLHTAGGGNTQGIQSLCDVRAQIRELAQARALSTLGLARRCGELVTGIDQVGAKQMTMPNPSVCIIASDLAPRSARKLHDPIAFLDSHSLGQALGMGSLGAAMVRPGRLAKQAAYWLRVWYETASFASDSSKDSNS